jgi:hypothetical protein
LESERGAASTVGAAALHSPSLAPLRPRRPFRLDSAAAARRVNAPCGLRRAPERARRPAAARPLRTRLTRGAAGLVEPGNRHTRDPGLLPERFGVTRTQRHDSFERAFVNRLDQLAEPRAQDEHVGRGERERQPLGRRVAALGVRFERVVAELRDGQAGARRKEFTGSRFGVWGEERGRPEA